MDAGDLLDAGPHLRVPMAEVVVRVSRSGGPGGQHANTSETRVEVSFDVTTSSALTDAQRALLLERVGPVARAVAADERSQARNRAIALERLGQRLAAALVVAPRRRPTRPSRAASARRLDAKRRQSERKADRRRDWS